MPTKIDTCPNPEGKNTGKHRDTRTEEWIKRQGNIDSVRCMINLQTQVQKKRQSLTSKAQLDAASRFLCHNSSERNSHKETKLYTIIKSEYMGRNSYLFCAQRLKTGSLKTQDICFQLLQLAFKKINLLSIHYFRFPYSMHKTLTCFVIYMALKSSGSVISASKKFLLHDFKNISKYVKQTLLFTINRHVNSLQCFFRVFANIY